MAQITPRTRLLHLRVLALRNVSIGYAPHQDAIRGLLETPITQLGPREGRCHWPLTCDAPTIGKWCADHVKLLGRRAA